MPWKISESKQRLQINICFLALLDTIFIIVEIFLHLTPLVIYLQGPHIASVTLSAWECQSLNFPEPPYPDEWVLSSKFSSLSLLYVMHEFVRDYAYAGDRFYWYKKKRSSIVAYTRARALN